VLLIDKVDALLSGVTCKDVEHLNQEERRRLAAVLRHIANLADPPEHQPTKGGILLDCAKDSDRIDRSPGHDSGASEGLSAGAPFLARARASLPAMSARRPLLDAIDEKRKAEDAERRRIAAARATSPARPSRRRH
jgi:hypothetical protein